jgi:nucleoside-diphosphate-sugar epimerase
VYGRKDGIDMKVLILGVDGYLGWELAKYLTSFGHEVYGFDDFSRRKRVEDVDSISAIPISSMKERVEAYESIWGKQIRFLHGNTVHDTWILDLVMKEFEPDTVVHLAEIPSAPYSMISRDHCLDTMQNNVLGTLNVLYSMKEYAPHAHLLKLGTMGEYGTPNIDIPEGFFDIDYRGRRDTLPFPKQAGSWYHWTKVHDSNNIMWACKLWDLSSTDIMQGVVYGTRIGNLKDERLRTRFDFDDIWGTAINRFCTQAVLEVPLTPYGIGGQRRGFIDLRDSMQCMKIAIEDSPKPGEYRVLNQFDETYNVLELAMKVVDIARDLDLDPGIGEVINPRMEAETHYYNPDRKNLPAMGFTPSRFIEDALYTIMGDLLEHKERIEKYLHVIKPRVYWKKIRSTL